MNITDDIKKALESIENKCPLTQCITNYVTVNDCANAVLAVGGSPIMCDFNEEVADVVNISDALVINIGTLSTRQIEAIYTSLKQANKTKTPVVFDPVGAGISEIRNNLIKNILTNYKIAAIRGNMSEIKALSQIIDLDMLKEENKSAAKGVDVDEGDIISKENLKFNSKIVKELALNLKTIVIASGPIDIISDGKKIFAMENGDEMMGKITGAGCMFSSIVGSFLGASESLIGSITATASMGIAGEMAREKVDKNNLGNGSFRTFLLDYLYKNDFKIISDKIKIYEVD